MATRHEITSIQFKADAGKANAAIDSIRQNAKAAADKVTELRQKLEEGKKANLPADQIQQLEAELGKATKAAKQWGDAQRNLIRGVKALDEAIIQFNRGQGSVEKMSAALSKAARNAAQLQQSRMERGSEGWNEMEALITALDKNLVKARQDFDGLVQTIQSGGQVSVAELTSAKQSLKELSDLTAYGSDEWKGYQSQLNAVTNKINTLSETERRLAGEVITVADAMKTANATSKEEAESRAVLARQAHLQAVQDRERAEGAVQLAKTNTEMMERELTATKEQMAAQQELVGSIEALHDAYDKAEAKMIAAETAVQKQEEETREFAEAAWEASKKVGELEKKLEELNAQGSVPERNATLDQLKKDAEEAKTKVEEAKQQLAEVQGRSFADSPRSKQLQSEIDKLQELIDVSEKYRKQFSKISDTAFEKGYMGKEGMANDERKSVFRAQEYLERAYRDRFKASVADAIPEDRADYPEYQAAARRVAGGIVQNAQENFRRAMFTEIQNGKLTSAGMEEEIAHYRRLMEQSAREAQGQPGGLRDDPEYNRYKFMIAQMEKYIEVARQVEAERRKIAGGEPFIEAARSDVMNDKYGEGFADQQTNRMIEQVSADSQKQRKEEERIATERLTEAQNKEQEALTRLNEAQQQATSIDQQREELQQQLADAQRKLTDAKQAAEEPNRKLQEADKKLAEARDEEFQALEALTDARDKMNLGEEEQKLEALERQHDELTESLQKQKQAETELAQAAADAQQDETNAAIELAQAQNQSQTAVEQSIAVLEKAHKTTNDGTQEYEDQAEALVKLKQRLAEMRGEVMSLADAEALAEKAMEEQAKAVKTGWAASTDELKRAEQTLADKVAKAKRGTKEEEAAYQKLVQKLQAVRTELTGGRVSGEKMMAILKDPKAYTNIDTLKSAVARARAELNALGERIDKAKLDGNRKEAQKLQKTYDDLADSVKKTDQHMKELQASSKGTASAFEKAWSRLKTYVGLYVGAAVAMQKLTATMGDLMELSDKLGEVRKTTGFTADEVGRLSDNLTKLDTRTSLVGLLEISAAAGQLGLKTEDDVRGFTEAANMLMVALPEMGREGATQMLKVALATGEIDKIGRQMQEGTIDGSSKVAVAMTKIGSTIDQLRANSASAAPAITDFVQRVGAVGAQSGISIDQVAALGSTVDALGMRVEMSATALSRMIPAIRNNAFDIAQAIGVTPETIRNLFDTGRGMEVILMILQHIKDTGKDADSVEQMLGMGGMADVMKDLNQQGARAGIVFAGLSQNVDELRRQLGVAAEAYEENIAIQKEYDKMNDTTAAKWERLKNQVEEVFVSDTAQRWLGGIIYGLRRVIDLITGSFSPAILGVVAALGLLKLGLGGAIWSGFAFLITRIVDLFKNWRIAIQLVSLKLKEMTAAQWANVFLAIAGAIAMVVMRLKSMAEQTSVVSGALADVESEVRKATGAMTELFNAADRSAVALDKAKQKMEEVTSANKDTTEAQKELTRASAAHSASIREINSQYGSYLGFMLSETSSAEQLAAARELVNAKLRESITLRQREAALANIEEEYGSEANKRMGNLEETIRKFTTGARNSGLSTRQQARLASDIAEAAQKYAKDSGKFEAAVSKMLSDLGLNAKGSGGAGGAIMSSAKKYQEQLEKMATTEQQVEERINAKLKNAEEGSRQAVIHTLNQTFNDWRSLLSQYQKAEGEEKEKLAVEVYKQQRAYDNLFTNNSSYFDSDSRRANIETNLREMRVYEQGLRSVAGETIRTIDAMERAQTKISGTNFTNNGEIRNNPWGSPQPAESINYADMNAQALVQRRKQMNDFVNALQTDTDVQSVLKEDAALKKAIENGMSSDMRTVIEWYNTERLKIQEELHARHLTNEGNWLDPKKERSRKKQLQSEWKAFLDELDAYYTERKSKIEEARNNEDISEAEAWRRQIANEAEWRNRRAELQQMYANKSADVTASEQQAIFDIIAERTGDSADFIEKSLNKTVQFALAIRAKSEKEYRTYMGQLDKGAEQDFLRMQRALEKQVKAIEEIINKERPFNGITENLQENLVKMGILTAELTEQQRNAAEEIKRTGFLLSEAEHAYSLTIDQLLADMRKEGFAEWADALSKDKTMQQGLLAMLRTTYDTVQDAIKKEASQIKKQVEILWNDAVLPGGKSMKQGYEAVLSALGLQGDQVERANQLIGAGAASERVADKLAIRQMRVRLAMQQRYYAMMRDQGQKHIDMLHEEARLLREQGDLEGAKRKEMDAQHVAQSMNLSLSEEQKKLDEQRVAIANQLEESQNRLYTELRAWGELIATSIQGVFEASNTGQKEFYTEQAKKRLTGEGTTGTYIVIENAGTKDARASYQTLSDQEVLDVEQRNAMLDAWKKLMDDLNAKMSETITDQLNAMVQNVSIDANTDALYANTQAILGLTGAMEAEKVLGTGDMGVDENGVPNALKAPEEEGYNFGSAWSDTGGDGSGWDPATNSWVVQAEASTAAKETILKNQQDIAQGQVQTDTKIQKSTQSAFAKMTAAANLYGVAYQVMSNDNMSASQKFGMIAVQAAGNAAITALTTNLSQTTGQVAAETPSVLSKLWSQLGWGAIPVFAIFTGLLGGLMGLAASKIAKSKSEIAQATGVSASAGRLATGMLTYAEGNVNEFTDPATLREGQQYNVDAADGRTYRARYMGRNPRTHLTNGPEFHLSGERGREMIIDAGTTRQITMNEAEIWHAIQTLSGGGSARRFARRGRGVRAFADGNVSEFSDYSEYSDAPASSSFDPAAMQASLDRNSAVQEALLERLSQPIQAEVSPYGPRGIVAGYDNAKKAAQRYGVKY